MDRRIFPRYPLDLPAEFRTSRLQVAEPVPCQMLDYSFGGLMLEFARRDGEQFKVGQQGIVSFQRSDVAAGAAMHQVSVRILRAKEGIIGACFDPAPIPAVRLALQAAGNEAARRVVRSGGSGGAGRRRLPDDQARALLDESWAVMQPELHKLAQSMPAQLHPALMAAARQVLEPAIKKVYLDSLGELSLGWDGILQKWEASLQDYLLQSLTPNSAGSRTVPAAGSDTDTELSILSEAEFESSLAIQTHAAAALRRNRETLRFLNANLNSALGSSFNEHDSPFGPAFLIGAFHEVAGHLYGDQRLARLYLDLFNEAVLESLDGVLGRVRQVFTQWNLVEPDDLTDRRARKREDARPAARVTGQVAQGAPARPARPSMNADPLTGGGTQHVPAATTTVANESALAPSAVTGLGRLLEVLLVSGVQARAGSAQAAPDGALSNEKLAESLGALDRGARERGEFDPPLQEWLRETLQRNGPDTGPVTFSEQQQRLMTIVEELFESIGDQALMPAETLHWLRRLQVPILRLVLQDPRFLTQRDHPARQVVNQLARIGGDSGMLGSLRQVIDDYLDRILRSHQEGPQVFVEVQQGLGTILERRREAFLSNVRRLSDAQRGQQRLLEMRELVAGDLRKRFGRRNLLVAVRDLVMHCWRDLLVTTALRDGINSKAYQHQARILEMLQYWLSPPHPRILEPQARRLQRENAQRLLADLGAGLEFASADPFLTGSQLEVMERLLVGDSAQVSPDLLATTTLDSALWPESAEAIDADRLAAMGLQERGIVRRLQSAESGTVLFLHRGTPQIQRARLAWKAPDLSRLLLTDDRGGSVREFSLPEFLRFAREANVEILGEEADSLLDIGLLDAIRSSVDTVVTESNRDRLTGVLGRREFLRQLEQTVIGAGAGGVESGYVLIMNVDWFDLLNAKLGHAAGDHYLVFLAELIGADLPAGGLVGRIGGDEFGVLLPGVSRHEALDFAESLRGRVEAASVEHGDGRLAQTVTIGGAPLVYQDESTGAPLQIAVTACRAAKAAGRNAVRFYDEGDKRFQEAVQIKKLAVQVEELVGAGRLGLRFQPVAPVDPLDPHHHHEALLLLRDDNGVPVSPQQFIIAAESYGYAQLVDRWVVENAMRWLSERPQLLGDLGGLAINLSGASLNDPDFLAFLLSEIRNLTIPAYSFSFEVTETAVVSSLEQAREFLHQLRAAGCRVALDDFGTGMASYAYLRSMPVDYLKIDGSFIREIATTSADLAVVRSINEVAHFLGIRTIAEYVENAEILATLREVGVDYAQGYEIGRPVAMDRFEEAVARARAGETS